MSPGALLAAGSGPGVAAMASMITKADKENIMTKPPVEKAFGEFMQQALAKPNKYPACQECNRSDAGECDACVKIEKWPADSDRIMSTIREEVNEALAAAKLAGYRQAQREEFHNLCGLIGGPEPHDQIIERIRHLRKELGL